MRRGSIVGPLILIVLGVLFLLRNVWPEVHITEAIALYWPYLLIAWGGLRLIEILFLKARSRALPRSGVSGGEWVLATFIFLIGSGMFAAHRYSGWFPDARAWRGMVVDFGDPFDYPLPPSEHACGPAPRVVLENFRGNARITGVGGAFKVQVAGRKTIRAMQRRDADQADRQTPVEIVNGSGNQIIVRLNQDKVSDRMQVSDDLDIAVPKGASVEGHGRFGDFDIRNIDGSADIDSDNSGVRLQDIGGDVRVNLRRSDIVRAVNVKGGVDIRGHGQDVELEDIQGQASLQGSYTGQLQFRKLAQPLRFDGTQTEIKVARVPGEIRLSPGDLVASNLVGPIEINARSRDIQISDFTQALDLTVDRGDIELRPGAAMPKLDVRTRSGDVDLSLPPGSHFDLKAQTDHGEIHDEYGSPLQTSEIADGGSIAGSIGAGPSLRLTTGRGSVTVRKAGLEANAAPEPPDGLVAPQAPVAPHAPKTLKSHPTGPPPGRPTTE